MNEKVSKLLKNYKEECFGPVNKRINFRKSKYELPMNDLLEVLKSSFDWFLNKGIDLAFKEIYPIESSKGKLMVEYLGKKFLRIEKPKNEFEAIKNAKIKNQNYEAQLYVKLRLINNETGEVKTDEVYFGKIPLMTSGGSFIINGSEKIIISQLVRSPGVYFQRNIARVDKGSGGFFNYGKVIPLMGSWIEMLKKNSNSQDFPIELRIDKKRKILLTTLLRGLGFKNEDKDIISIFGKTPEIIKTLDKEKDKSSDWALSHIYSIIRSGDRSTNKIRKELFAQTLFNKKRYNLSKVGRFTMSKKLQITDRIWKTYLFEDLINKKGKLIYKKDTYITNVIAHEIQNLFSSGELALTKLPISTDVYGSLLETNPKLKKRIYVIKIKVKKEKDQENPSVVIGIDPTATEHQLLISDLIAIFSYFVNLNEGLGLDDDVDSLWNKRIRSVGELLQNKLQIGLSKMERNVKERMNTKFNQKMSPKNITNNKAIINELKKFFNSSQLSQFMDQINPLSEISTKRRVTSLGPSGLSRDTAQFDVRDVNSTHYGRLCPIETPEGPNIGLILNFATYSRINEYGFIETPYFKVVNRKVIPEPIYMTAKDELGFNFGQATIGMKDDLIINNKVVARCDGQFIMVSADEIDFIDISSKQFASIAAACIPFLENDDANRALMGSNMQRQAVPLIIADAPYVGTGIEAIIAKYSATNIRAEEDGIVSFVDSSKIQIKNSKNRKKTYKLKSFERSNQGTMINQVPIVKKGDEIKAGSIIVDGPSFDKGELAIGQNVLVGFSTWNGFNYEDAIVLSERLVKKDIFTSIHIERYIIKFRKSKIGSDILTSELPNVSKVARRHLDSMGVVRVGSEVIPGDVLVGRTSPKVEENITPEEKLLKAIFLDKSKANKDTSLKVKYSQGGTVTKIDILSRENGDKLDDGVEKVVTVFIAQKRKISVGDKMSGRHGNKGVVSRVLPIEDMPHLEDGTPLDVMLNPLGVPSRMNIGQVLELHLGLIGQKIGKKFASPIFDGATIDDIEKLLKAADLPANGKFNLIDGITGEKFDKPVAVGIMYMLKLNHMIDDKMHARSVGPYSLITQQPLGGKTQNGGQRFGEMEVWALESYGASKILQEILTYKSDDIHGRNRVYNSIVSGTPIPTPGVPESFNVLSYELAGLCLKTDVIPIEELEIEDNNYRNENTEEK